MTIDDNCGRQAQTPTGLKSFASTQVGLNDRFRETLGQFQGQLSALKLHKGKLIRDLNLEWRTQSIEDDLAKLHKSTRVGDVATLSRELLALKQHALGHEMEKGCSVLLKFKI